MAQAPAFRPTIDLLLAPELVAAAQATPVLTPSQLHVLRQQIEALRRINVQLRVLKYRARTGADPVAPSLPNGGGRGRGRGRGGAAYDGGLVLLSSSGRGRGRGRGRCRGKRGREDESEEDDSIVAHSDDEAEEAALGSDSSEEEGMLSDEYESADSSESEEDYSLPAVAQPRRTGRMRRPSSAASQLADVLRDEGPEDGGSSSSEEEVEEQQQQQQQRGAPEPAGPEENEQGQLRGAKKQDTGGTAAPASSGGAKRRGLFMVVSEDTTAASGAIHLPQLKPFVPPKPGRAAAAAEEESSRAVGLKQGAKGHGQRQVEGEEEDVACDVCGDAEAIEGNVILLCEGKRCSVAVHQQCYGVHKIPEGKWLCEACKAKLKPRAANCCVCPVVGGAVKQVTSLGRVVPATRSGSSSKGKGGGKGSTAVFCHLACALWVPEIEFADHEHMSGVRLHRMTRVRARLRCEICKQAGGAAVQCAFGTCCRSFHVLCGRAAGQQLTFRATDGEPLAFCELHSRPAFEKMVEEYVDGKRSLELRSLPVDWDDGQGAAGGGG